MLSTSILKTIANVLVVTPLLAVVACSAAPGDGTSAGSVSSTSSAISAEVAGAKCSSHEDCAVGFYCEPTSGSSTCGKGTCTASPGACPMIDAPVCGCDGSTYLNACWATIGEPGKPGTTSTGNIFVDPTKSELVGTWSRESGSGSSKVTETLVLGSDLAYTLTESTGCSSRSSSHCTQGTSTGSFTMSTVGIVLDETSSSNAGNLATEFYLENTCPIGGPLQLVGAEPPGSGTMITLTK